MSSLFGDNTNSVEKVSKNKDKSLRTFWFGDSEISIKVIDDKTWFLAKDVCAALDIKNVPMALTRLYGNEKLLSKVLIAGQRREVNLVSETGLYKLIFTSSKKEAEQFQQWVFTEVIPEALKERAAKAKVNRPKTIDTTVPEHRSIVYRDSMDKVKEDGRDEYENVNAKLCLLACGSYPNELRRKYNTKKTGPEILKDTDQVAATLYYYLHHLYSQGCSIQQIIDSDVISTKKLAFSKEIAMKKKIGLLK